MFYYIQIFPELEKNLCEAAVSTFKLEMQQQQKQRTEKHKMQFVNT